jgi:hypothetical protein
VYPAALGHVSSPYRAVMSIQFPAICVGVGFVVKQNRLPVTTLITVGLAPETEHVNGCGT